MKGVRREHRGIEYYMQLPYSILLHQVEEDGKNYWMAEVPQLPGCRSHGSSVEEAVRSVEEAKKDWILDSLEEGDEIPLPVDEESYSGRFVLRISRSLHRALSLMAESEKLSLNQLIVTILAKEVGKFNVLNRVEQKIDNLLDRINEVVEEQRTPTLKPRILAQYYQSGYLVVGTSPDIEPQVAVGAPAFPHGVASTASPLEELQSRIGLQSPGWGRIVLSGSQAKGVEDAVVTKHE